MGNSLALPGATYLLYTGGAILLSALAGFSLILYTLGRLDCTIHAVPPGPRFARFYPQKTVLEPVVMCSRA